MSKRLPKLLYADEKGNIYDHPDLCMAGMNGIGTAWRDVGR